MITFLSPLDTVERQIDQILGPSGVKPGCLAWSLSTLWQINGKRQPRRTLQSAETKRLTMLSLCSPPRYPSAYISRSPPGGRQPLGELLPFDSARRRHGGGPTYRLFTSALAIGLSYFPAVSSLSSLTFVAQTLRRILTGRS